MNSHYLFHMDEEAKNERVPGKNSPKETSLGKRKISEVNPDNLDSVIVNEPRKKIQKVSHSSTTERESAEKMNRTYFIGTKFCAKQNSVFLWSVSHNYLIR